MQTDESSQSVLQRWLPFCYKFFLDEAHGALAEQIGVHRLYFVDELSADEDALSACRRALVRTLRALAEAHNRLGAEHTVQDEDMIVGAAALEVTLLLESDVDPSAPERWGW